MQLERLLAPRSIAVYGASENRGPGRRILEMLDKLGYDGVVYPVNPRYDTVLGKRCYATLGDIPEGIDAIVFGVNHGLVMEPFRMAAARGYGAAVVLDAGFAERDEEGKARQAELLSLARDGDMAVCGPNCMGVLSPHQRTSLYTSNLLHPEKLPGNVAVVTQSGSIAIGLLSDCRRFGFSHVISEAADKGKPVVVLKVGRSERSRHAISGHTGGLAGEARVFSQILKRHRAIEVGDMDELTEVLACCQGDRWPTGRAIGLITGSGGQAELILDVAGAAGVSLPPLSDAGMAEAGRVIGPITGDGNPLDAWGNGRFDVNMPHGLKVLADEPAIESIVMVSDTRDDSPMVPTQYTPYLREVAAVCDKPCYFMNTRPGLFRQEFADALREAGIATIGGTRQGLGAIDRLARWSAAAPPARSQPSPGGAVAAMLSKDRSTLNEVDAKMLLGAAGLPVVQERTFIKPADAAKAADEIGYPVVLKVVSDDIPHKSDHGLVAVGLSTEADLIKAVDDMSDRLAALSPPPSDAAFVVQEMITDGVEMFMGVSRDPDFGLMLAFGLGGVAMPKR
jgi:acyl-CoA synthetase (NDP forming)